MKKTPFCLALGAALVTAATICPRTASAQKITIIDGDDVRKKKEIVLDPILDGSKMWSLTYDQAEAQLKDLGFKWVSETSRDRGMIRRADWGPKAASLHMFDKRQKVEEVIFDFKAGKLASINISIWNKGDSSDSDLSEAEFKAKIEGWTKELDSKIDPRHVDKGKDSTSAAKAERRFWAGKDSIAQLEYAGGKEVVRDMFTGRKSKGDNFQGEFVRLRLAPKSTNIVGSDATTANRTTKMRRSDLPKNLKRETNGDVLIPNVPMVDQGDKGYCAVATAARVLNYYGVDCDQHEMAKAANTAGDGGTDPEEMEGALRKLQGQYHVRLKNQIQPVTDNREWRREMEDYNRAAKRMGKRTIDLDGVGYYRTDPDVLREAKGKGPEYEKFMKVVRENIDKGIPMLWALRLGLYPENGEKNPQSGGGHMRLIIGYNVKDAAKTEIIFSDSWGPGHEIKRIAAADASAATLGLYSLEPESQ